MSSQLSGQTSNKDTIDYSLFSQLNYCVVKILDNKNHNEGVVDPECCFKKGTAPTYLMSKWNVVETDTLVAACWDQDKRNYQYGFDFHQLAKLHVKKESNLIILERLNFKSPIIRKFKILKLSTTELVLHDWLNKKTYFFKYRS
ncbi:MAG: hypothetical protein ACXVPF_10630 [Bacteroidia bacterium]